MWDENVDVEEVININLSKVISLFSQKKNLVK